MKVVMTSDTHDLHRKLEVPDGDIFIHAGDILSDGMNPRTVVDFNNWLGELPHKHKFVIAGNHDFLFEKLQEARSLITNATYLQDESASVEGLKIYGSPWQPEFFNWAFNLQRGSEIKKKWDFIPEGTDILITHGPPWGYLDEIPKWGNNYRYQGHVGCEELLAKVIQIKPIVHVFGHIHNAAGYTQDKGITYVNASACD